jgi:hypothetical protein
MSTLGEATAIRHTVSEYHVYHEGEEHVCLIPFLDITKEFGYKKRHHKWLADDYASRNRRCNDSNSYFIHRPVLAFHDPPRTLLRGSHKLGKPICIINSSAFWRDWNIQFVPNLEKIIDRRGVVKWEHRTRLDNRCTKDDRVLEGYKVRSWRIWGETGAAYHRSVNARRKALREEGKEEKITFEPAMADEVVRLKWASPFTNPRRYSFTYAGIAFFWEGTRDLPDDVWSKRLMPLNHLKLIGQIPGREKVFLAHYRSDFSSKKFGRLLVFDSAISRLLEESGNTALGTSQDVGENENLFVAEHTQPERGVKNTRLYDLVMATSICMVIGEWQKRLTVWLVVVMLVQTGNGMTLAGGGG